MRLVDFLSRWHISTGMWGPLREQLGLKRKSNRIYSPREEVRQQKRGGQRKTGPAPPEPAPVKPRPDMTVGELGAALAEQGLRPVFSVVPVLQLPAWNEAWGDSVKTEWLRTVAALKEERK
ncbi:MAG: hypothetical protein PHU08_00080 [Dehalococcoidales bacterium]|nr:hypothetical protein [Dehalococcoidales bacterium]